jgi:hypothetical protein
MSQRKVQNTIVYLESRGLIKRIGLKLGGEKRGNYYQVLIPENVPAARIVSVIEAVARRTPTKINSKYFVKEIIAQPDPHNRAWQKKRLQKIAHKIRDISVGRTDYLMTDFVEDVKCNCAREGIVFENDLFNESVN